MDSDGEDESRHTCLVGDGELQPQFYMILVNYFLMNYCRPVRLLTVV